MPESRTNAPLLVGVDFSSSPTARKPVVLAWGTERGARVSLIRLETCATHARMKSVLSAEAQWVGGFDLPFGLPRELVEHLGWPTVWSACMDHYAGLTREQIRDTFAAFTAARPVGAKFAHRACDRPAGSSPSMKWVNPPVAYMLHAGVPLLRGLPASLPGLEELPEPRVALEAYPGMLARELIGNRSYKSDDRAKQTTERLIARKDLVDALEQGRTRLGLRVVLSHAQREQLVDDASGDTLDAVLCLMQVAWAQGQPNWGLPAGLDPLEGWIVSAGL
jgi:hypothetical protein